MVGPKLTYSLKRLCAITAKMNSLMHQRIVVFFAKAILLCRAKPSSPGISSNHLTVHYRTDNMTYF
jgi:hypothetical protein